MPRISLAQLAGSVRKFNLNRPFVCPILISGAALRTIDKLGIDEVLKRMRSEGKKV